MTVNSIEYADKISALLAKANDPACTPAEAEAYTDKAEHLMVKWGISDALIDEKRSKQKKAREKVIEHRIYIKGTEGRALSHLGFAVARGLGIRCLQSSGATTMDKVVYFIGFESDVKRAVILYDSLALQALAARMDWWSTYADKATMGSNAKFLAKRQFIWSFAAAVEKRLTATREEAETEVKASTTGTDLVLASRTERVDQWVAETYPKLGKGRSSYGSLRGQREGRAAGEKANLGGTQVGTGTSGAIEAK